MPCHISATSFPLVFLVNFLLFLTQYSCVFLEATTILANSSTLVAGSFNATCIEEERNALLEFKHGLEDPLYWLDSWVGKDCCEWAGIACNDQTGNVIELYLSDKQLSGTISVSIGSLSHLETLDLSRNSISGPLPTSIGNLSQLETLYLGSNKISGPLPISIGNLSHLKELDISNNKKLNGNIPKSIGQLGELKELDLSGSSLDGIISENHFQNLTKLVRLQISSETSNSFFIHVTHDWIPPFNLTSLSIEDCHLTSPAFPAWLRTQQFLTDLSLSNVGISDTIPNWFWRISKFLSVLELSDNQLRGNLPNSVNSVLDHVYLENNCLEGSFPLWPNVSVLSIASNRFSGPIPLNIGHEMPMLWFLDLSRNNLNGTIPLSTTKRSWKILDLSRNYLSGNIPTDWTGCQELTILDLSNNNLSGKFPSSMCSQLPKLEWLRLRNNHLSGELAPSLHNCSRLLALDLTRNNFFGAIPNWIGEMQPPLYFLLLGANMFTGNIPEQLCGFSLQILDLSRNNLSGSIPRCLGNLGNLSREGLTYIDYSSDGKIDLNLKGVEYEYGYDVLQLINQMDLSSNNLWGEVPEINNLTDWVSLNLSHNHLTGKIPEGIGSLHALETLDLSSNNLLGPIPSSMIFMTSLSLLNLSYNNLSGRIPSANQFLTFNDPRLYEGNSALCGPPLPTQCSSASNNDHDHSPKVEEDEEDKYDKIWLYASKGLGFIVGFWVIFGSLVIKRSWRHTYFQFLDKMKDRVSSW